MKSNMQTLIDEMDERLQFLQASPAGIRASAAEAVAAIESNLKLLADWITNEGFSSPADEIDFFRNMAPKFFSKLIYFQKIYQLEIQTTYSDLANRKQLYKQHRKKIRYFFTSNAALFSYYASGSESNDNEYFLRSKQQPLNATDDLALFVDTRICTIPAYKIAKMLAYKKLDHYLLAALSQLSVEIKDPQPLQRKGPIQWTASKIAATELIYGLFSSGIFNNGQAKLKEIIFAFEQSFQIDLTGYQSTYQDMKMRKKSRTAFLSDLRQKLESKMDDEED